MRKSAKKFAVPVGIAQLFFFYQITSQLIHFKDCSPPIVNVFTF